MTYPLGWSVIPQMLVRRERWPGGYKAKGTPLVHLDQEVLPDQPVLRIERAEQVESVQPPRLSLPSVTNKLDMQVTHKHDSANKARSPETIPAGMYGRVVDVTRRGGVVIESRAAIVQGAIGAGNQVAGILSVWQPRRADRGLQSLPPGAVLVVPGPLNFSMLRQAMTSGVTGVVASSISARDLEGFLQADLIQLINSVDMEQAQMHLPAMTLFLTEGLGTLPMPARIMNLLNQYQGSIVLLSGTTSIRQRIFPELVISLPLKETQQNWHPVQPDPKLTMGAQVRVCSGEYEGAIGVVDYLFTYQQVFASGVRARALRLRREDGSQLVVPMALVERIG